jgi:hypothetical protein
MINTPDGRYQVFNVATYPDSLPAGSYELLLDAINHADSVTYKMAIIDIKAESRGFIYCNWEPVSC